MFSFRFTIFKTGYLHITKRREDVCHKALRVVLWVSIATFSNDPVIFRWSILFVREPEYLEEYWSE
jgi:hypothetical protein